MKRIAAVIALSVASSTVFAATANVSGTLSGWKSWNAASKAPIPYFVAATGLNLVQANNYGDSISGLPGAISLNLTGVATYDSVSGAITALQLSQVGSYTGWYDTDGDLLADDSVTLSGLSWNYAGGMLSQTSGLASGCITSSPVCAFTVMGVNSNDHGNGLGQSVFDFRGVSAGFKTLPRSNSTFSGYGTYAYKTWAATAGASAIANLNPSDSAQQARSMNVASMVNSGTVTTNSANTAQLNLTFSGLVVDGDKSWIGGNAGLWSTAANWNTGGAPVEGDKVYVVQSGSLNRSAIYDSSATTVQLEELNIGASGTSGSFTFIQNSGTLNATTENIGYGENWGENAIAKYVQNGGFHTVGTLNMGVEFGNAEYRLNAGQLVVTNENIGYGGSASFIQDGGSHQVTGTLKIGTSKNDYYTEYEFGSGGYTLNNGTLNVSQEYIGDHGSSGSFTQNGGTHTVGSLTMGDGYPDYDYRTYRYGYGRYTLNGGTFNVGSISNGYYGHSELIINGGTLNLTGSSINVDDFSLGHAAGSNANFTLAAGKTLNAKNEMIGKDGVGHFIQNGGNNWVTTLDIKNGSYDLNAGSLKANTINNSGQFTIAAGASAIGQDSGGGYDDYGYEIPFVESSFNQVAGTARVDGLLQAKETLIQGGTLQGNGTIDSNVTVTGGTIQAGNSIGALTIDGNFNLNGGTLLTEIGGTDAGEFDLLNVINGNINLNSGTLAFDFVDGFEAEAGDEWVFLSGNVTGSLDNMVINYSGIPAGLNFVLSITASGLKLSALQIAAVPVPAAVWMMGTSLIGLAAAKRRKKAA